MEKDDIEQLRKVNRFLAAEQLVLRTLVFELMRRTPDFDGLLESVQKGTAYHSMRSALSSNDEDAKAVFEPIIQAYTAMISGLAKERKRGDG